MARPSRNEQALLESLEGASATLVSIQGTADLLGIRWRAVDRRINGASDLAGIVAPALLQQDELHQDLQELRTLLHAALAHYQEIRCIQNRRRAKPRQ